MCKSCNAFTWSAPYIADDYYGADTIAATVIALDGASALRSEYSLAADGVGTGPAPNQALVALNLTTDDVPDSITGSNPTITVGGAHVISTIDTPGDQDFYAVQLQGGVKYNIGMYGHVGGPSGVPQPDAYIELYDAAGNRIGYEDGKGRTPSGEAYGLDAMLTITVDTTGTYYVNARAFEQDLDTDSTTTGDTAGDYDLFVEVNTDPPEPVDNEYYPMTSPLRAIDWGTQVDGTVRNPDGNEGTINTGNPQGTPDSKGASVGYFGQSTEGKNVIKIYFAKPGDTYASSDPTDPGLPPAIVAVGAKDYEVTAIWTSLREFEKVADIVYVETQVRSEANFHYVTYSGTPGPGISLLGSMNPPQENDEGLAQFNSGDYRWNATNLQQGGFSFVTLIHEFGHGHGLAHPHDTGGNSTQMPGVKAIVNTPAGPVPEPTNTYPNYTRGEYDLNQGVFTMMSYQDGWETSPYGNAKTDVGYGYLGGLMAMDIAVIQSKYGVNEDWATGDDVYSLKDVNEAGTFYTSIWDGGGSDEIRYTGARDAGIDLRPATLKYEFGGGGFVSYAYGIYGGFTVANGVTIEKATSGSGNDRLIGNAAANVLSSGVGNDFIDIAGGGVDTVLAGEGNDVVYAGTQYTTADQIAAGAGNDTLVLQGNYAGLTFTAGSLGGFEGISVQGGAVTKWGQGGGASYDYNLTLINENVAPGLQFRVNAQSLQAGEDIVFNGSAETDGGKFLVYAGGGTDTLTGGSANDIFHFEAGRFGAGDRIVGGGGSDAVVISGAPAGTSGAVPVTIASGAFSGIESLSFNGRFASDPAARPSYSAVMQNGNIGGGTLIVNGSSLEVGQRLGFDGWAVGDGKFRIFGGADGDTLRGGAGDDVIEGGGLGDAIFGGNGKDVFVYRNASDSVGNARDVIHGFHFGNDKIDLSLIDADANAAGNQAFAFIGSGAFTNKAGELRAGFDAGRNLWSIEGDVNGDGLADFQLYVNTGAGAPPVTDFIL
ncbi:MAG TPA: M10 family metallopeptidase C-terminal domain-containing protein [Allosphingosinicella sp.]|jgi:serralysin